MGCQRERPCNSCGIHARKSTRMPARSSALACASTIDHTHACMRTRAHARAHAGFHVFTHARTPAASAQKSTRTSARVRARMPQPPTRIRIYVLIHARTRAHVHTLMRAHTHARLEEQTSTRAHAHARARMHACTPICTHSEVPPVRHSVECIGGDRNLPGKRNEHSLSLRIFLACCPGRSAAEPAGRDVLQSQAERQVTATAWPQTVAQAKGAYFGAAATVLATGAAAGDAQGSAKKSGCQAHVAGMLDSSIAGPILVGQERRGCVCTDETMPVLPYKYRRPSSDFSELRRCLAKDHQLVMSQIF